ncbi:glycerol kinase GlpK [Methylomicrobium sp. Wu6]|uniref:glycerol kinase GlpK n=1 Tax=Methylomicrobium sp. Wu6 TaxID=3107928 RepID=UPI002DD685FE|nr:glycerol kinase GlpK [Methylomicrobium sp. Wu6]
MRYVMAIDQGTSSSRCMLYDLDGNTQAVAQREIRQIFPEPGWVEHDPEEIWQTQAAVCLDAMRQLNLQPADIAGIGITNQRETVVVWDRKNGKPIYNAIVWQDRRTTEHCARLKAAGCEQNVQVKTGLLLDPYFSATKIRWILEHVDGALDKARQGELAFGTIDSWLVWKMTRGELHITDVTNASRTLLFNIDTLNWDQELLDLFEIPAAMLPEVKSSSECYGLMRDPLIGEGIPIAAIVGDQQASLFGQLCVEPGMAKCTYGTGSFLVMNTGSEKIVSNHRLLTTIAWKIGERIDYALEGSVFVAGAAIQWLRDELHLFADAGDSENLAASVSDNGGVYFVPAFTGLGAPFWDPAARGAIFGLTRGTTAAHIARAALESVAFQVDDILRILAADSGRPISQLRVDGGVAANQFLVQFQSDISALKVVRPAYLETTALGAAYLAGIAVGVWTLEELANRWRADRFFHGTMPVEEIESHEKQWRKAVERVRNWAE